MNSNKLEMVKCEKFTNNVPNNHTEKSVNFPVTQENVSKLQLFIVMWYVRLVFACCATF